MKKIRINLIASIVYQIVAIIYGFVLPKLILENFGSEVNGLLQSVTQFLGVIGFLDMGVGQVVRSALYKPLEDGDSDQVSRIMATGGRFYRKIAYALLGYVGILLVVHPILVSDSFNFGFVATMIAIMAVGSFVQYYFGVIQEQLLHAHQKSYLIYASHTFCYLLTMAVCVCMIKSDCSVHAVKLATCLIFLVKPFFCVWYVRRKYRVDWRMECETDPLPQKRHGVAQHISGVVLDGTDNIVLTLFSTLSNVSIYSVYFMIVNSLNTLYQSAAVAIQSAAGQVWARQDEKDIRRVFSVAELCLHKVTVFLFCCAGLLIVPFVKVYTAGVTDVDYIQPLFALLLVLAYGIRCLRTPYNIWILAAGHFKQSQRCHITAALLNLVISIALVFRFGLIGIAIGTLTAMCYQTAWMMLYVTKKLIKCGCGCVIKQMASDALSALLIYLVAGRIGLQDVTYGGWIVMALKTSFIAMLCIAFVSILFYPKQIRQFIAKTVKK